MELKTISRIRELRDEIRKLRKRIRASEYEGLKYGPEEEYTAKGLLAGLDALIIDISTLVKTPAKFIKLSIHGDRNQIINILTNIQNCLANKDMTGLAAQIDQLKSIVSRFSVRLSDERAHEFSEHIDNIQRQASNLSLEIEKIKELKSDGESKKLKIDEIFDQLTEKLNELDEKEEAVNELISEAEASREKVSTMLEEDQERSESIEQLLTESKSHKEVVENFSKRIAQRESQLEDQQVKTEDNNTKLNEYEKERLKILKEAKVLITSAKTAMEYKTAEGLSDAFNTKYIDSKDDETTYKWIQGAIAFVVSAVGIGIWVFFEKDVNIEATIGRLSMIPILIGGAWFCAGQFVKQRNIAEDYGYKSVLAKSIVGFSEHLANNASSGLDDSNFIKSVLSEIHNDPLRHRAKKPCEPLENKDEKTSIRDVSKLLKTLSEKVNKIAGD